MFTHIVLFWLKPEAPETAAAQLVEDCEKFLKPIPGVRQLLVGRPAMTPRTVVDNSYHVGIVVVYDDRAGHDAYQEHPLHQQFLDRQKTNFLRVQVYDFL